MWPPSFAPIFPSNTKMSNGSDQRVRHVAIVLQSLDAATSRGLLSQLPPAQSKAVRQAMVNMGSVSAKERATAFESMQGLLTAAGIRLPAGRTSESSDDSASPAAAILANNDRLTDQVEWSDQVPVIASETIAQNGSHWQVPEHYGNSFGTSHFESWQHLPSEVLAEILQGERPIVIATVINQVSVDRATAIVQSLPMSVAGATLAALPHLHLTDPAILRDIQQELERKIGQHVRPQQANAEGLAKLQAIIENMPATQHDIWTNAVSQSNPLLANKLGWNKKVTGHDIPKQVNPIANQSTVSAQTIPSLPPSSTVAKPNTASTKSYVSQDIFDDSMILPFQPKSPETHSTHMETKESSQPEGPNEPVQSNVFALDDLSKLSDQDFVKVLHSCQPQTVLMAISGASKQFVSRVERLMPPKDVKRLRLKLANIGPLQLREVDAAQNQIVEMAMKLLASGRIGALENVTFTAAA